MPTFGDRLVVSLIAIKSTENLESHANKLISLRRRFCKPLRKVVWGSLEPSPITG